MSAFGTYFSSATNIFDQPMKEVGLKHGYDCVIRPLSLNDSTLEYVIDPDIQYYLKTDQAFLKGRFKIVNQNGQDITDKKVAPVNFFPCAYFESMEIYSNDTRITGSSHSSLPYRRYLETLLSYNKDARDSHLELAMFKMDSHNDFRPKDTNTGYVSRKELVHNSKECEFTYYIQDELLNVDRYYPNNMKLRLIFHKNSPEWCLMEPPLTEEQKTARGADFKYQIKLLSMDLIIRKVLPTDSILMEHERLFAQNKTAKYPITKGVTKKWSVMAGTNATYLQQVSQGPLPQSCYLLMVDTKSDLGNLNSNPFYFKNNDVRKVVLKIDGFTHKEYNCDFTNNNYTELLTELYRNIGISYSNQGSLVDKNYFKNGCSIISFNLSPDKSNSMPFGQGTLSLDILLGTPLTKATTFIVILFYEDILQIDASRNMIVV